MPLVQTINSLRTLYSTPNFKARYSVTGQVLALFHILSNPYHPIQHKLAAKYARQQQEFVLVVNTTKKSVSGKACVRNTIARRIRDLALTELRERGWSRNGTVLGLKNHQGIGIIPEEEGGGRRYPLKGSLAFFPFEESITTPREVLRREVETVVERFLVRHEEARIAVLMEQLRNLEAEEAREKWNTMRDTRRDMGPKESRFRETSKYNSPSREWSRQTHGGNRSTYEGDRPTHRGDRPTYGGDRPTYRGDRPTYGGDRPTYGGGRPTYRGNRPTYGGARPPSGTKRS